MNEHFGKKATDTITGFTGFVTGYAQYITGCDQYLLQPACKKGEAASKSEAYWFDVNRLTFSNRGKKVINTTIDKGPCEAAPIK